MDTRMILHILIGTSLSMLMGGVIGWERESTHRPAGLRTHMLVTVGACIVMQLGTYTVLQYGTEVSVDPSRLGAQVISGIGFLGAGTIMKEGVIIKGLTTAASLWVVACLGLAVGSGAYMIAIIGFIAIILTLTVFERAANFVPGGKKTRFMISIRCEDVSSTLNYLNEIAIEYNAQMSQLQLKILEDQSYKISFKLSTYKSRRSLDSVELLTTLNEFEEIKSVKLTEY